MTPRLPPVLAQPPTPAEPAPVAPRPPLDTRQMTDQELLDRAGPKPNVAKLFEEESRRPVFSRRLPPGPYDCKPASEHSDRIAPPCPTYAGPPPRPLNPLANRPDLAGLVATKDAFKAYGERYGPHGMANPHDFPGMGCKTLHTHCGPEPEDPGANGSTLPRR
ncbi:MAG: hypothetical protein JSR98_06780 [Proteobacteria bacterium]|nr:hypothetical protein [Pseudomonadota bacterium]